MLATGTDIDLDDALAALDALGVPAMAVEPAPAPGGAGGPRVLAANATARGLWGEAAAPGRPAASSASSSASPSAAAWAAGGPRAPAVPLADASGATVCLLVTAAGEGGPRLLDEARLAALRDALGEGLDGLAALFPRAVEAEIDAAEDALRRGDAEEASRRVHSVVGMAANFGAGCLGAAALAPRARGGERGAGPDALAGLRRVARLTAAALRARFPAGAGPGAGPGAEAGPGAGTGAGARP